MSFIGRQLRLEAGNCEHRKENAPLRSVQFRGGAFSLQEIGDGELGSYCLFGASGKDCAGFEVLADAFFQEYMIFVGSRAQRLKSSGIHAPALEPVAVFMESDLSAA